MISVNIAVPASFWMSNLRDAFEFSVTDAEIEKDSLEVGERIKKYEERKETFHIAMPPASLSLLKQLA